MNLCNASFFSDCWNELNAFCGKRENLLTVSSVNTLLNETKIFMNLLIEYFFLYLFFINSLLNFVCALNPTYNLCLK